MSDLNFKFDFEKLNVYQKSLTFIDEIFMIYKKMPFEYKQSLGNNLIRAALSIGNNIAEGNGKKSKIEKKRYFDISSGSARECVSVFNVLARQKLLDAKAYAALRLDAREITSMLRGLIDAQS